MKQCSNSACQKIITKNDRYCAYCGTLQTRQYPWTIIGGVAVLAVMMLIGGVVVASNFLGTTDSADITAGSPIQEPTSLSNTPERLSKIDAVATSTAQANHIVVAATSEAQEQDNTAVYETQVALNATQEAIAATSIALVEEQNAAAQRATAQSLAATTEAIGRTERALQQTQSALRQPQTISSLPSHALGRWHGVFHDQHRDIPMVMIIEETAGQTFSGRINYPDSGNTTTIMQGRVVTDFSGEDRWNYLSSFQPGASGVWLTFTEPSMLPGGNPATILNGWYYAHIGNDGMMTGIFFESHAASKPRGSFEIQPGSAGGSLPSQPAPSLGNTWAGVFHDQHRDIPMVMYIEESANQTFAGRINYPDSGNTTTVMQGWIVTDLSSEEKMWEYVPKTTSDGTWIKFTEPSMLPGGNPATILNGWYYAQINGNTMSGVFFKNRNASRPYGTLELKLQN